MQAEKSSPEGPEERCRIVSAWSLGADLARQDDLLQLAGADALDGAGDRALVRGRLRGAGDTHLADPARIEHRKWLVCEGREAGTERRERLGRIRDAGASIAAAVRNV